MDTVSHPSRGFAALWRTVCSLFAGTFLFWLIETAASRRVFGPGELFTFFSQGEFFPGKTVLFCVCICLCLFVGLSSFGGGLLLRLNETGRKDGVCWLLSAAVVAVFFLWTSRIAVFTFMTNDDTALLKTVAGIPKWGIDYASGSFSNVLFCALLSLFYRINPEGWWYTLYHLVIIFCSCTVIGRCILLKTRRHGWSVPFGCLIHFFLCAGVFLYGLSQLSFTVTPAIAGSAAVALILCRDETKKTSVRILLDISGVILMLLCYLHRPDSGKAVLCFWALAIAYQVIRHLLARDPGWKRKLLGLGACALSVLVLMGASRSLNRSETTYDSAYWNAEYYRSMVMDYLIEDLTAEEAAAAGIPGELLMLLRGWYFMDERISTETFRTLVNMYYTDPVADISDQSASLSSTLQATVNSFLESLTLEKTSLWVTVLAGLLLLFAALALIRGGRQYWPEFLCALCALGGALLLCLYLVLEGRFPVRVFFVAFIPAVTTMLLMALSIQPSATPKTATLLPAGLSALVMFCCGIVCFLSVGGVPNTTLALEREDLFNTQWQVETYANEHSDILFITNNTTSNLDPLHGGSYPSNIRLWGGTGVTASSSRLYDSDFFRDDIRLMYKTPGTAGYIMLMLQFLTLDNGPVYAINEAQLDPVIFVFDFEKILPSEDYTGWYDWNGMTYYFENGEALTGTHVIDGTEYEFAPAGAKSPMMMIPTENAEIYTTKAYSLVAPVN